MAKKVKMTKAQQKAMDRRPKLIKEREYTAPEYADLIKAVEGAKSAQAVFETIKDNYLRAFVMAYRHSPTEMPEWAYTYVRNHSSEFNEMLNEAVLNASDKHQRAFEIFRYWVGYDDDHHQMKLESETARAFNTHGTGVFRSIFAISNLIRSHGLLSKIGRITNNELPPKNTTTYREIKQLLTNYAKTPTRYILTSVAQSEKERIMLLLFRNTPELFTEDEYDRLVKSDAALKCIELQLMHLLPIKDEREAVKQYLGIGCEPAESYRAVVDFYWFSSTTLRRRVDYVLKSLRPQLNLK